MTWFQFKNSIGFRREIAQAKLAERDRIIELIEQAMKRNETRKEKEFADGFYFACQEIYAWITSDDSLTELLDEAKEKPDRPRFVGTIRELVHIYAASRKAQQ